MPPDLWLDDILNGRAAPPPAAVELPDAAVIWVDADAMPRPLRDVVLRAAERVGIQVLFVANIRLNLPDSPLVRSIQVAAGPDVADDYISDHARAGDLAISQDIPLAARLVPMGVHVLQTSGRELDEASVQEALALRDLKEALRETGEMTGGPPPFHPKQKQRFANALDRWLTRALGAPG
jgi:uncharacterized protein YaiI (UPF0178 family)